MKAITAEEIQLFAKLIFDVSGLHLDKDKGYLLETRLNPVLNAHGYASFSQLYYQTKNSTTGNLEKEIVEAMTTNETFFFRDHTPFDLLRHKIIPDLIDRRTVSRSSAKIPIRIWSAACSTGQEVYSIAMTLAEMFGDLSGYDIYILGTDIADKVIAQASYGKYNQFEMDRGLPPQYRKKYFTQIGTDWRIKDEIRSVAQFKTMNLMKPFPDFGLKFDIIFCRNVAIYFNQSDKVRLFQKIAKALQPDGALIVGGSETLTGIAADFESRNYLKGIFYQLSGFSAAAVPRPSPSPPPVPRPAPARVQAKASAPPPRSYSPVPSTWPASPPDTRANSPALTVEARPRDTITVAAPAQQVADELAPSAPDAQQADALPRVKKSLLAAIHSAAKEPAHALLSVTSEPTKTSLLDQLKKKKRSND